MQCSPVIMLCLGFIGMDHVISESCYKGKFYKGIIYRERSGSVVECLTRDRRAAGSSLTGVTALWSLSKTHLS